MNFLQEAITNGARCVTFQQVLSPLGSDLQSDFFVSPEFAPLNDDIPFQTELPDDFLRQLGRNDRQNRLNNSASGVGYGK